MIITIIIIIIINAHYNAHYNHHHDHIIVIIFIIILLFIIVIIFIIAIIILLITIIIIIIIYVSMRQNFDLIKTTFAKASPSLMDAMILNSINRFCTLTKADQIEAFFVANPLPSSQRRISQALENMRTNGKMLEAISSSPLAESIYWS
jgi:hypothetical protein